MPKVSVKAIDSPWPYRFHQSLSVTASESRIVSSLLQVILVISFFPTIRGLLKHELREKGLPWNLSVLAYSLMVLAILVDPTVENRAIALVYPIVNGVLGNGSVALIIWLQARTAE